jgi:Tfp pilus assembly protein PilF
MNAKLGTLVFCFFFFTSGIGVLAQTRTSTPAPPSTITRPGSIQDSGLYDYWTEMSEQGRAGGVLLGKLAVEGEPLPWEPILVSVLCKGTIFHTALSDPKGRFVITSDHVPGALSVQGDAQRQMETHFEGCTVQASLSGFRSNSITITQRNFLTAPDLGTLTLYREQGRGAGTAVSSTSESAPENAKKSFEKARSELLDQKPDRAQRDLEKAVEIYPSFADAWYQLGMLQETSSPQDARKSFTKALEADPKFVLPYERLAALSAQDGKWQEVVDNTSRVLKLDSVGTAQIWYYDALGNFQLGNADEAKTDAIQSLAMDPQHTIPNTEQLLAVILAQQGDYAGALERLRHCLTYLPSGPNTNLVKQQIAQIEPRVVGTK